MKNLNQAFTRIKQINWNDTEDDKISHRLLVNEVIRRCNVFRDIYDKDNRKRLAIFSGAKTINAYIPKNIKIFIDDMNLIEYGWSMATLCEAYLEWQYLIGVENEVAIKYKDLYEPIIKLFERGGRIGYHNNELLCGKSVWPRNCYLMSREVFIEDISDEILDAIDLGNE